MSFNHTILMGSALLFMACTSQPTQEPQSASMPMNTMLPMETFAIATSNPKVNLKLAGELKPYEQTQLFAKVNSYVKQIKVDIGDRVVAGQTLVVLEAPEIAAQLAQAKAKVQAQEALYIATKATYDRILKANETQGAVAKDAVDQIMARKLADASQLHAARANYQELKNIQDYLVIKAPFSGTITQRNIDLGAYVSPMQPAPLLVIENNEKLRLNVAIPEANTAYLKFGDSISFYVRSQPQEQYWAVISRKSGSLNTQLRTEKIEADVINKNHVLKPHMIAETSLTLQNQTPTFFVPKTAVVETAMGIYVIKIVQGKTQKLAVRKGRSLEDTIEIFGVLEPGDLLLKMANEEITEGMTMPSKNVTSTKK